MDRFLRSLLTSSAAASMEAEKSLSEIARAVLVERSDGDPRSLREKAGLLALLNLLGIVEAFYGGPDEDKETATKPRPGEPAKGPELAPVTATSAVRATQPPFSQMPSGPPAPAAPAALASDSPISMVSTLARLMASAASSQAPEAGPQAGAPPATGTQASTPLANLLGGVDPALIAGMLGLLSGLVRPRPLKPPTKVEGEPVEATSAGTRPGSEGGGGAEEAPSAAEETAGSGDQAVVVPGEAVSGQALSSPAATGPSPAPAPPSPLQQVLGIDPKILTLILNLVAELMKPKAAEPKDKAPESRPEKDDRTAETPAARSADARRAIPVSPRKSMVGPRLYHKPGLGIYRSAQRLPKPAPGSGSEG